MGSRQSKRIWGSWHSSEEQGQSWVSYVRLKRMGHITLGVEAPVLKNQCWLLPVLWPASPVTQTGACSSCRKWTPAPALEPHCVKRFVPSCLAHNQTLPDPVRGPIQSLLLKVGVSSPCFSCACLIPVWFPVLSTPGKPCDHQDKPIPKGLSLAPFICLIYFIEVELISSIVLISAIQQSDSIQCDSMIYLHTHTHIPIYTHTCIYWVSQYIYIGLAQRFVLVFPYDVMQKSKWIFGPVQYILFYSLFHYGLSQDIESSSLCSTVEPCLSILYRVVCMC